MDSAPDDVIIEIFSYLDANDLCRVSRVCKRWDELSKTPILWRNVSATLQHHSKDPNIAVTNFAERLPNTVVCLQLYFDCTLSKLHLVFENLAVMLQNKCKMIQVLAIYQSKILECLSSILYLCSKFLKNLKTLFLCHCEFGAILRGKCRGICQIENLHIMNSWNENVSPRISMQLPYLEYLCFEIWALSYSWFSGSASFLKNLKILDLSVIPIESNIFNAIKENATLLTTLYVCSSRFNDEDMIFSPHTFPFLKTICLRQNDNITFQGIVSLIQSCPTLENIFIREHIQEAFAAHPFVADNRSHLKRVNSTCKCDEHRKSSEKFIAQKIHHALTHP